MYGLMVSLLPILVLVTVSTVCTSGHEASQILDRLERLEAANNKLKNNLKHVQQSRQAEYTNLQLDNQHMGQDNRLLKKDNIQLKKDITLLKKDIAILQKDNGDVLARIDGQQEMIEKLHSSIDEQNNQNLSTSVSSGMVAFTVRIAGFTGSPSEHSVIPFDIVDLNQGGAYDPLSGYFTAPVAGFYHFSWEFRADYSCVEALFTFFEVKSVAFSDSGCAPGLTAGAGVTIQLAANDVVHQVIYNGSCLTLRNVDADNRFSGHLIYQII